jgi:hypothetical protein
MKVQKIFGIILIAYKNFYPWIHSGILNYHRKFMYFQVFV